MQIQTSRSDVTTDILFTESCTPGRVRQAAMAFAKHCPHELSIPALKRHVEPCSELLSDQFSAALLRALALLDALIVQAEQKQIDFETALGLLENQLYAARLDSPDDGAGQIDWRISVANGNAYKKFDLPPDLLRLARKIVDALELEVAAIDITLDQSDEWYFFEANPYGQYTYIEDQTEQPLSEAMAQLLIAKDRYLADRHA